MPDHRAPQAPQRTPSYRRARAWLIFAIALAVAAGVLGMFGYSQVAAQPEARIHYIVEDGLPYGITQETVEAAAEVHGAVAYEPITMMVVERELEWDEYINGELPDGVDILLSIGYDADDLDLSLPRASRVGVVGGDEDRYSELTAVRETLMNNLTMGHGAGAVVGASITAADTLFDGATRSPLLWGALTALPLLASVWFLLAYIREVRSARAQRGRFDRARLQLARIVLELDTLEMQFSTAEALLSDAQGFFKGRDAAKARKRLRKDWEAVRESSLELARVEQALERDLIDSNAAVHSSVSAAPADLDAFETDVATLARKADSLAAAASLRVGHANSDTVLARLALPITQAIGEILRNTRHLGRNEITALESQRTAMLALVRESKVLTDGHDDPEGADAVRAQSELLQRWSTVETHMVTTLDKILGATKITGSARTRAVERIRATSAGATESQTELRGSLGLPEPSEFGALVPAERVLLAFEQVEATNDDAASRGALRNTDNKTLAAMAGFGVVAPIVVALLAGMFASFAEAGEPTGYGREVIGDVPLASMQIYGDMELLPNFESDALISDATTNYESISLEHVRDWMERAAEGDPKIGLFPTEIDLTVTILPAEGYLPNLAPIPDSDHYEIAYPDLLEMYDRLEADVSSEYPEVFDAATGDIRLGQAILPIWVMEDGSYSIGLPLTGEISAGVDSRLGAYYFLATELRPREVEREHPIETGTYIAFELGELGRTLEYNHMEIAEEDTSGVFWTVTFAVWGALQTVLVLGGIALEAVRSRRAGAAARAQLSGIRSRLEQLALGLDLSRLDMVAVLGAGTGEKGDAAQADQRLYETALVTAWRQAQALESLPPKQQRGPEWEAQVADLDRLVSTLADQSEEVSERALEVIRASE
ncbi:hypothetical protein [Gulosibacter sp. ACHW.36C]|uniref:DUF5129 domain-containing protein n=1 Tax=Gulosibacter sediminis TaxID=1729695 RepID=A0ABY4MWJ0_9MICO|nr:hypothetical protein [Gulosibacter sediminis]UQN14754.1 hypothetical protein M3M28_12030 [Gulosibacter sediminis]